MITLRGVLPFMSNEAQSSGSTEISARPLIRRVSPTPGTRKRSETRGSRTMLRSVSMRLLPRRSGIMTVFSSTTRTNPAGSPRGEQSRPSSATLAQNHKRRFLMNDRNDRRCNRSPSLGIAGAVHRKSLRAPRWSIWCSSAIGRSRAFLFFVPAKVDHGSAGLAANPGPWMTPGVASGIPVRTDGLLPVCPVGQRHFTFEHVDFFPRNRGHALRVWCRDQP
ncbi:MAG: hypothetical protein CM15mP75_0100 [Flammeovirgaceae bacterium]|nr:MAG: hypothetical protein CM15mP75_0100 [Flammeovirgaceae bacterium]